MSQGQIYNIPNTWEKDTAASYSTDCNGGGGPTPPPPTNQSYIEFTTTKAIGETIEIVVNAKPEDQADVWIDLNNNGTRESGEEITKFNEFNYYETNKQDYNGKISYTIVAQTIRIYGEVTAFSPYGYYDYKLNKAFGQEVSNLDVTHNIKLEQLYIVGNKELEDIDLSANYRLRELACNYNSLKELNISNNRELNILLCWDNKLTRLETSNNRLLGKINCMGNQITQLDISNNKELYRLNCGPNNLTSIDISQNQNLSSLDIYGNQIESIDVSQSYNLGDLRCSENPLVNLDVSHNTNLRSLECQNTQLSHLDVSMCTELARDKKYKWNEFDCTHNANLTCVKVSQEQLENTEKNWKKDEHTQYSTNCKGTGNNARHSVKSTYHKPTKFYYKRVNGRVLAIPAR